MYYQSIIYFEELLYCIMRNIAFKCFFAKKTVKIPRSNLLPRACVKIVGLVRSCKLQQHMTLQLIVYIRQTVMRIL